MTSTVNRTAAAALIAAALLGGGAALGQDSRAAEDRQVFADGLFSREMYRQASIEYARLIKDFPDAKNIDRSYFRLGEALRIIGRKQDAAAIFLQAGQINGEYRLRALFKRAALFLELGQDESAAELFAELLKEQLPAEIHEHSLYYYAEALNRTNHAKEAAEQLESLVAKYPKSEMGAYAKLSLGRIYAMPGEGVNLARSRQLLKEVADTPPTPRLGAEALFLLARAEFSGKNFKEAANLFSQLETKYPDDLRVSESRLQAAWAYSNSGLHDAAIKASAAALEGTNSASMQPDVRAEYTYIRAGSYFQLLRYEDAVTWYGNAVAADPNGPHAGNAHYQSALSLFRLGKFAESMAALEPILTVAEFRERALWLMAEAAVGAKDAEAAVQHYKLLVAEFPAGPFSADAYYRLGNQLMQMDAWVEASGYFLQLAERFPESPLAPQAVFASAHSLEKAGQDEKALRDWDEYAKRFPSGSGLPEVLFRKAAVEMRLSRNAEALATLDSLLQRFANSPRTPDAHFWRAQLLREKGSLKDAEAALNAALAAKPSDDIRREARFSLAMVLLLMGGREAEAAAIFQELVDDPIRAKFTPQQFAWLSDYQFRKGEFAKADSVAHLLISQSDDTTWQQAGWTLSGKSLRSLGKLDEAEAAFRKAVAIDTPTLSLAQSTLWLAEILLEKGKAQEAEALFRVAVARCAAPELQPYRIYAYTGLGRAALADGRKQDAAKYLMTVSLLYRDEQIVPPVMLETISLLEELGMKDEAEKLRTELRTVYPDSKAAASLADSPAGGSK